MKADDLLKAIDKIDERFIDEAFPQKYNGDDSASDESGEQNIIKLSEVRSKSRIKIAASIAACLCLVAVIGTPIVLFGFNRERISDSGYVQGSQKSVSESQNEISYKGSSASSQNGEIDSSKSESKEIYEFPKWSERSISQQYTELAFNNLKYFGADAKISQENIGDKLGTGELSGYDEDCSVGEKAYKKNGTVFTIKSIASRCAVAVKFEESDDYFIYRNSYYKPETLGDFIEDLSLKENIRFGSAEGLYEGDMLVACDSFDKAEAWKILLSDESLKTEWEIPMTEEPEDIMNISISVPAIGHENIGIWLTKNGYLCTNIMDTQKRFNIGKDKVQEFIDYVIKNGKVNEASQSVEGSKAFDDNASSEAVCGVKF